jgi:dTDP-4-amino-4,6-dideoxygalactose transaminase
MKKIKFNDLSKLNLKIERNLLRDLKKSIKNSNFIGGEVVKKFENNFKKLNESKFCISCANGSDALFVAIKALGIKSGEEVIVTSFSWIASSAAITMAGGKVVFCDIEKNGFNIDPNLIEKKITKKTRGIIVVHLYGYPANMKNIMQIAKKNKIWIIEDCAQAHLASINGKKVGNFGNFGTFSFFPGKNLGALGDAGCLVTNSKRLAYKARLIANHGGKGLHLLEGINSRMDSIQANFLNLKIKYINKETKKRIQNANLYNSILGSLTNIKIPKILNNSKPVYHQYTIRTGKRDKLKYFLEKNGVETQIHYRQPLVAMKAYKYLNLNLKKDFRNSQLIVDEILSLPVSPDKNIKEIKLIANLIKKFFKK